jgi:hypothetical protein
MDKLSDLPPKEDTELTPQEDEVMKNVFGGGSTSTKKKGWMETLKLAGLSTLLFVALANPWIDVIFSKLPYCGESATSTLMVKALLFLILWIVLYKYLA